MLLTCRAREHQCVTYYKSIPVTCVNCLLVGAPLAGHISDLLILRWRKRRGGEWVPEDRLRVTMIGAAIFVPLSVLCPGLITHYIEGRLGLGLNLICLFFNGLGVSIVSG